MNSARLENSERLRRVLDLLQSRGAEGATTREVIELADCAAVSAAMKELKDNGHDHACQYEGETESGCSVYRYWYRGYNPSLVKFRDPKPPDPSPLLDSDPPAPLADSDSPTDIGCREIPEPAPDVPAHLIGEVIRFERMGAEERKKYRIVCEGHVAENICILCKWCCDGSHEDVFPSYARKAHVLVCCDPSLPSNAHYLGQSQTAPADAVAFPQRDVIGRPARGTPSPAATAGAA